MHPRLQRLRVGDPLDAVEQALAADGGAIVEGFLDPLVVARIREEVAAARAAANPGMKHLNPAIQFFFGDRTRHVNGMAAQSRTFATEVLIHPVFLGICDRVLLPSCARYQLNLGHLIDRGPGSQAQLLHRDEDVWVHVPRPLASAPARRARSEAKPSEVECASAPARRARSEAKPSEADWAELQVASMIALEDFRVDNGATRIVPGSHRWPRERKPEPHEVADAVMPAGSAVIYLGSTIHGAGANSTSEEWRPGLHISYTLGWLRTEENNYLAVPPAVARKLPRKSQEVLGYAVHDAIASAGGYLGMLGLRDPVELMAEGEL
jgi:ectoine hydroxylase-related dioxygenase (phytanoyl-CoA dioxygenase family)